MNKCARSTEECPRLGRFFGGCKFEGRYSYSLPEVKLERVQAIVEIMSEDQLAAMTDETYVCDVCIRCGKVVKP